MINSLDLDEIVHGGLLKGLNSIRGITKKGITYKVSMEPTIYLS